MDYTVHLTEGYIMAKKFTDFDQMSNKVSFAKVLVSLCGRLTVQ